MIDTDLVERTAGLGGPSAFREVVDRHGPAVLRACRRLIQDPHEADDAFQATFLILIRRGPSIRDPERLDRWLAGVVRRVASHARRRGHRRSARERRWAAMQPTIDDSADRPGSPIQEARLAVREEMELLPEAYRGPLALCYFEGLSHEEAAGRLGCPVGTIKARLVRGRRLLRDRLDRRGFALSVTLFLLLQGDKARAAPPPASSSTLLDATVEAMSLARAGDHAALESLYPGAVALARGIGVGAILHARRGAAWALALALAAGGVASWACQARAARDSAAASARLLKVLEVDCR